MIRIRLLPSERLAAMMLIALLAGAFLYDWLWRVLFIIGPFFLLCVWFLALLFAVLGIVFALKDDLPAKVRVRNGAAMPVAMAAAYLLFSPVSDAGRWVLG